VKVEGKEKDVGLGHIKLEISMIQSNGIKNKLQQQVLAAVV